MANLVNGLIHCGPAFPVIAFLKVSFLVRNGRVVEVGAVSSAVLGRPCCRLGRVWLIPETPALRKSGASCVPCAGVDASQAGGRAPGLPAWLCRLRRRPLPLSAPPPQIPDASGHCWALPTSCGCEQGRGQSLSALVCLGFASVSLE